MRQNERGFSLLEVVVALTILGMAFAVLFSMSSRSLDGLSRVEDVQRRVEYARAKLDELRFASHLYAGDSAAGRFEDGTDWRVDVLPFIEAVPSGEHQNRDSVIRLRLSLQWQGRSEPQTWTLETYRFMPPPPTDQPIATLEDQLREIAWK